MMMKSTIDVEWELNDDNSVSCTVTMQGHIVGESKSDDPRPEWSQQKALAGALGDLLTRLTLQRGWHAGLEG